MTIEMRERTTAETLQASGDYDVERIRSDFPILYREVHGKPLVYLDNGASAQKPTSVIEAMDHAYRFEYANVHRGLHYLSNTATQNFEDAREAARRFLNAPSTDEVIITRNATGAINLVAQSFGGMVIGEDDEIILSIMEHHSNIVPWHYHRERNGAVIKWVPISDDGEFLLEEFARLITPLTKMVAITHMSNVLGTVNPIAAIAEHTRTRGIALLVDGSQALPHMQVNVSELGCDFYVFTGHKLFGPTGTGALWARRQLLEAMPPWIGGGEMIESVSFDGTVYAPPPRRFEAGTPNIAGFVGLAAAIEYLQAQDPAALAAHEQALGERLRDGPGARRLDLGAALRAPPDHPGRAACR